MHLWQFSNSMNSIGIYIHTPFCVGKCGYCDFYSMPPVSTDQISRYVDALCIHIKNVSLDFTNKSVDTVYFGGGTPSILGANNLCRILDTIKMYFSVEDDAEITTEANPGDITLSPLKQDNSRLLALTNLKNAGFNRISLGVQSSNDDELKLLSRRHTFSQVVSAVNDIRTAGFDNLTLDLMYGLPNQTFATWKKSLLDVMDLKPQHISCYALRLEENAPMYKYVDTLPSDDTVSDFYDTAVSVLCENGYRQYEVSNFAFDNYESRHNSRYWKGGDYLGFGPAAHSFVSNTRYAYSADIDAYCNAVLNGSIPPMSECTVLDKNDLFAEYIMLHLRMADGIDFSIVNEKFSVDTSKATDYLSKLIPHGLVKYDDNRYSLTARGMFVQNTIILDLFTTLDL